MSIGTRLRNWRKINKLNTTDIRDATGISTGALSNYENDKREISSNFLLKIKELYDADIMYILTGVKNENISKIQKELLINFEKADERGKEIILEIAQKEADRNSQQEKSSASRTG